MYFETRSSNNIMDDIGDCLDQMYVALSFCWFDHLCSKFSDLNDSGQLKNSRIPSTLLENSAVWKTESNFVFLTRLFLVEFHANISIFVETKEIFNEISW